MSAGDKSRDLLSYYMQRGRCPVGTSLQADLFCHLERLPSLVTVKGPVSHLESINPKGRGDDEKEMPVFQDHGQESGTFAGYFIQVTLEKTRSDDQAVPPIQDDRVPITVSPSGTKTHTHPFFFQFRQSQLTSREC